MTAPVSAAHVLRVPAEPAAAPGTTSLRALFETPGNRAIMLDASRDPNAGLTIFLIPGEADQPRLAVKLATNRVTADLIVRESRLLADLECQSLARRLARRQHGGDGADLAADRCARTGYRALAE